MTLAAISTLCDAGFKCHVWFTQISAIVVNWRGAFVAKQSFSNNNAAQSHHTCQSLPSDKIIPASLFLSFMGATFWAILSISVCASLLREN